MERYYVVRIYRRPEKSSTAFVGVIEDIADGRRQAFHSLEELGAVLAGAARSAKTARRPEPHDDEA